MGDLCLFSPSQTIGFLFVLNMNVTAMIILYHNMLEPPMYKLNKTTDMQPKRNSQNLSSLNFHLANLRKRSITGQNGSPH